MSEIFPAVYIISLDEIVYGGILVAISLTIHCMGMLSTLRLTNAFKQWLKHRPSFLIGICNIILASWCITVVHLIEVVMWAGFFQWHHCFENFSTACYFALMEYTTVGSSFDLPQQWRMLEGLIATGGLLGFAWSTAVLMTLAQDLQNNSSRQSSTPLTKGDTTKHHPT